MRNYAVTMKFGNGDVATKIISALDAEDAQDAAIDACDAIGIASGTVLSVKRVG